MKLIEALQIANTEAASPDGSCVAALCCGFTPLHLKTFVAAYFRRSFPARAVKVKTGLYGDLAGTIENLDTKVDFVLVAIEWPDLDARLGLRTTGNWGPASLAQIVTDAQAQLLRLQSAIEAVASRPVPVVICPPTLPFPPVFFSRPNEADSLQLNLRRLWNNFAAQLSDHASIALVNPQELDRISPPAARHDARAELASGFPYQLPHTDVVARLLVELAVPRLPKKGLITDLDDTVWLGILGDDGVQGISWDLDHQSQLHATYQQLLNALVESGVLLAVASNNDPSLVAEAFARADLVLNPKYVYPVEASRGPKSEAIKRILQAWNVAPDSLVFVDDNPLELAEVGAAYPGVEGILFPKHDPAAILEFFRTLRDRFGKRRIHDEDRERLASLRQSREFHETVHGAGTLDSVLQGAEGRIKFTYDKIPVDSRALELINKTNQFNLNARRYTEASWSSLLSQDNCWLQIAEYEDRFARLGKISVIGGYREGNRLAVSTWVMSCRAFSRRIEYHCLRELLEHFDATEIEFDFIPTERNGPVRDFLAALTGKLPESATAITAELFREKCPPLYHQKK
ncbi:MAG TPA: HAD-IIIC family phosphatase [Terriglobales bacterium]|jgi:FkbH-like protein|nr:HAD-IIIC family phosphatase [Terriglobales bacterium]